MKLRPLALVVDGEMPVRAQLVEIARTAGFDVVSVATADEAVLLLEAGIGVLLLFADGDMRRSRDGMKLTEIVRERWPSVGLIVSTGRNDVPLVDLPACGCFFAKPEEADTLRRAFGKMAQLPSPARAG
jgi:DNA-binding NtrC family response regulator